MSHESNKRRAYIRTHLESSQSLNKAAFQVFQRNLSIPEAATKYEVNNSKLKRKIDNVRYFNQFYELKSKFTNGVREVLLNGEDIKLSVAKKYGLLTFETNIAEKYGISFEILLLEVEKARNQGLDNYIYDSYINFTPKSILTYLEVESLWNQLDIWKRMQKESGQGICICQLCALEKVSTFAYYMAQIKDEQCPEITQWTQTQRADVQWLIDFEMIYSNKISSNFVYYKRCLYEMSRDVQ